MLVLPLPTPFLPLILLLDLQTRCHLALALEPLGVLFAYRSGLAVFPTGHDHDLGHAGLAAPAARSIGVRLRHRAASLGALRG